MKEENKNEQQNKPVRNTGVKPKRKGDGKKQ